MSFKIRSTSSNIKNQHLNPTSSINKTEPVVYSNGKIHLESYIHDLISKTHGKIDLRFPEYEKYNSNVSDSDSFIVFNPTKNEWELKK